MSTRKLSQKSLEAILTHFVVRCGECGWRGVVLEYLPAFEGLDAFGNNGLEYCPECGEIFHESAE